MLKSKTMGENTFQLQKPDPALAASFERFRDAVLEAGEEGWGPHGTSLALTDIRAYIEATEGWARVDAGSDDWVPFSTYWITEAGEVVGELQIRHELVPRLREMGGHIGYHTHPHHRDRGVATFALRQGLNILNAMGVRAALVTCDDDNAASARVIEKCGAIRVRDSTLAGLNRRRYVIPLADPSDLGDFADLR